MASQITTLPAAPSRADPSTFSTKADALLGALATFVSETNTVATEAEEDAATAETSALAATASANVTKWISGTTYAEGDNVWSPINFSTYRRKTNGAGTTDPSADTTNWSLLSANFIAASQAEMEAATNNTQVVTSLNTKWHPGVAKAWIMCDTAGAIQASHNITSITDTGTGLVTITIATDFSSVNYCVTCSIVGNLTCSVDSLAVGSFIGRSYLPGTGYSDPTNYFFACFGDQ